VELDELNAALPEGIVAEEKIGEGGQREVFRASREGVLVALKVMEDEPQSRARLEREISAGLGLEHPNLVKILDEEPIELDVAGNAYIFFTEELVTGDLLLGLMGNWTACEVLQFAHDLSDAVNHLWSERRLVHRDIKPNNIIRATDGRFVLLDVGIARHQGQPSLTNPAAPLGPGTWGYYSPEQLVAARGRDLDHRSDFFAIGVVCFEALFGSLPFDPNDPKYIEKLLAGTFTYPADLPRELATILSRLLAPQPHLRYRTVDQAIAAIEAAQGELGCF
jgi:serine/threonine protein kinase